MVPLKTASLKSSARLTSAVDIAACRSISPTFLAKSYAIASVCTRQAVDVCAAGGGLSGDSGTTATGRHAGDLP